MDNVNKSNIDIDGKGNDEKKIEEKKINELANSVNLAKENDKQEEDNIKEGLEDPNLLSREKRLFMFYNDYELKLTYDEYIENEIEKMKNETMDFLRIKMKELNEKYDLLKNKIHQHLINKAQNISKALNLEKKSQEELNSPSKSIQNYTQKNICKHLNDIFNIHSEIVKSIKNNMTILENFLDVDSYLDKEVPIQEYLVNNLEKIYNSWLFLKIDFNKYNLTDMFTNRKIPDNIKEFILKNLKNKFSEMKIEELEQNKTSKEQSELDKKNNIDLLGENIDNLYKLQLINISNLRDYFQKDSKFSNLKNLKLENCYVKSLSLSKVFPHCNKLQIKMCPIVENIFINLKLKDLFIEKCNLINTEFHSIMNAISADDEIRSNIVNLSFAKNYITIVNLNNYMFQRQKFPKLCKLDFRKNKIYQFTRAPYEFCGQLKLINVSNNHLAKNFFPYKKGEKTLILTNNNIYLTSEKSNTEYYELLKSQLSNMKYEMEILTLSGLFNEYNKQNLLNIKIDETIQICIKKLDLSNCSLTDELLFKFFEINPAFLEVRSMNLSNNNISDGFFNMFINNDLHKYFQKLTHLNLSGNNIKGKDFGSIAKFIKCNKFLTKLNLCKNPFSKDYVHKSSVEIRERSQTVSNLVIENLDKKQNIEISNEDYFGDDNKYNNNDKEVTDLISLIEYAKYLNSEAGRTIRNYNKREKGFIIKFDTSRKINLDNVQRKFTIDKKEQKNIKGNN